LKLSSHLYLGLPCTVIPRYTNNRLASFRLLEMHTCFPIYEPIFAYTSSFLSQTDRCSRRLFSGSNGKLIFVVWVFTLQAVLEERIKLVNQRITVVFFLQVCRLKFVYISHPPHVCYICRPPLPPWLNRPNNIWWGVRTMNCELTSRSRNHLEKPTVA
jgi:hypothetical protein